MANENTNAAYLRDIYFDGDVRANKTGDLQTVTGRKNFKQAMWHRMITSPGSLAHRPDYGVGVKDFQNDVSTIERKRELATRIGEQFPRDPRCNEVTSVSFVNDEDPSKFKITVKMNTIGFEDDLEEDFFPFAEGGLEI